MRFLSATSKVVEEREIAGETDFFVHQDQLPGVSEDIKRLYSEYLRQNIPINYSDNPDLARDPLTLSLLVDPSELLKFINQNKKSSINRYYFFCLFISLLFLVPLVLSYE